MDLQQTFQQLLILFTFKIRTKEILPSKPGALTHLIIKNMYFREQLIALILVSSLTTIVIDILLHFMKFLIFFCN